MKKLLVFNFIFLFLTASAQVGDFESYDINIYQGSADSLFTVVLSDNRSDKAEAWQNVTGNQVRDVLFKIMEKQVESEVKARVDYELSKARTARLKESFESLGLDPSDYIKSQSRRHSGEIAGLWQLSQGGEVTDLKISPDLKIISTEGGEEKEVGSVQVLSPLYFIAKMDVESEERSTVKLDFMKFAPGVFLAAGTSNLIMKKLE